jgi:hypothetical protein
MSPQQPGRSASPAYRIRLLLPQLGPDSCLRTFAASPFSVLCVAHVSPCCSHRRRPKSIRLSGYETGGTLMTSTRSSIRSEFLDDMLPAEIETRPRLGDPTPSAGLAEWRDEKPSTIEPSSNAKTRRAVLKRDEPSLRRRAARSLIIFCIGIAATLAWQSYGDAARDVIASSYPQLGWLAPQTAAAATAPEMISPAAPAGISDSGELKSLLINLAAVRQSVDQLAAQFVAGQQQVANEIAKLKATEQEVFDRINSTPPPRPAAPPTRKPVSVAPQSAPETPAR